MKCLVLDALGVIFSAADDVAQLLIPFIVENGFGPLLQRFGWSNPT